MTTPWYGIVNAAEIPSPALLVYPDRIADNLQHMVEIAGDPEHLRPHVKTHKLAEVVRMQVGLGIHRFKCATIAEMEMTLGAGAKDALLAYQPVGPNGARLRALAEMFPKATVGAVADSLDVVKALGHEFSGAARPLDLYLDIDCGMHRTGIEPSRDAAEVYKAICVTEGVTPAGIHAYDGHNHQSDLAARRAQWELDFKPVLELRSTLESQGHSVPTLIASGSPTFPLHAKCDDRQCSPGTTVLWDFGYSDKFPDMGFKWAALLLTRVISKPGPNRLCLDLGHKAVAADRPQPRARLMEIPSATPVVHSEEHLMVETTKAGQFNVGDCLYAIPAHVCPTVALHDTAVVVEGGQAKERWAIEARQRRLTV